MSSRILKRVEFAIAVDDPASDDCRALLDDHLAFARAVTPAGHVHALGAQALSDTDILFFSARRFGSLLGVGALRRLDDRHAEIKAMHTAPNVRGRGIGAAMVRRILDPVLRPQTFAAVRTARNAPGCVLLLAERASAAASSPDAVWGVLCQMTFLTRPEPRQHSWTQH